MTAVAISLGYRRARTARVASLASAGRMLLLRIELRRKAMIWLLPVLGALFWFDAYRTAMSYPAVWDLRASVIPGKVVIDFATFVAGASAWMGTRETRCRTAGLVTTAPQPGWARRSATLAATFAWVMAAYLGCVAVLYAATAAQATWGTPPWWPVAVGAAALAAVCAIGFAAGAFFASRFTPLLAAVAGDRGRGRGDRAVRGAGPRGQARLAGRPPARAAGRACESGGAAVTTVSVSLRARNRSWASAGRLLRLELRRNAMIWMLPLLAAAFWFDAYHWASADPPVWDLRASELPNHLLRDFSIFTAGVAAWMGTRDSRRRTLDMVTTTPRPGWARLGVTWAGTTGWVLAAYLACVAVLYGVTAAQATWGGPPWWPVAVCGTALVAVAAIGFTVGVFFPSRFTAPLTAIVTLLLSLAIRTASPYAMVWPTTDASTTNTGGLPLAPSDAGVFYHYLPDLSVAQVMFLAGIALVALGGLGLSRRAAGGPLLRGIAAAVTVAGLAAAGTATGLIGTARQGAHGVVIPALHDAASDRPIAYTPVCDHDGPVAVCLHPAYRGYLADVASALGPVLREVAGLPGAPARVDQVAADALTPGNNSTVWWAAGAAVTGSPPAFRFPMPNFPPGTAGLQQLAEDMQETFMITFVDDARLRPDGTHTSGIPAQQAVEWVLLQPFDSQAEQDVALPGADAQTASPAVAAAARRFAALPAGARHAWLAAHLPALRAGQISLEELP